MKYEHKNDMHINNVLSFMEVSEIDFYGPGYTPESILEKGIEVYLKKNNRYDAIILDFALALLQTEALDIREAFHWHRYALSDYSIHMAIRYADAIVETLNKMTITKIVLYWYDTFTFRKRWEDIVNKLLDNNFYFLGPGIEFFPEVKDEKYLKKAMASNRYRDFCKKNKTRIISMCLATVNYIDCCMIPLNERSFDITIPGNLDRFHYPERAKIEDILKSSKYKLYDNYQCRTMGYLDTEVYEYNIYKREEDKLLDKCLKSACVYMDFQQSRESVVMWRENYNVALRNSKMGYACGAVSQQIVRKFAEIPSRGALLLCADIPPLTNYGFIDGENAITVTTDNVIDTCEYFLTHIDEMQKIADNGRKMIYEKHTAIAQARLVVKAIDAINKKQFIGSRWENGQFIIE